MHRLQLFDIQDLTRLHSLIREHALGTLIIQTSSGPYIDHLPFVLVPDAKKPGLLKTHASRANHFWTLVPNDCDCTVVFSGPNAYISPSWYPSRSQHGRVQPSWYYSVVHARGKLRLVHDAQALSASVRSMTDYFERDRPNAWRADEAPRPFIDMLIQQIVGIDIELTELVGKWQVGQQRNQADRHGIVSALRRIETSAESKLADTMLDSISACMVHKETQREPHGD